MPGQASHVKLLANSLAFGQTPNTSDLPVSLVTVECTYGLNSTARKGTEA